MRHAAAGVPHYRRSLGDVGIDAADVRSVADLSGLPILTRAALQDLEPEETLSRGVDPSRLVERWSSGSSGR